MKLTANITLDELTKSQTAERKGINNNPSPEQIENLKALAVNILQPVRSHFDKALIISSGFRCAQLCVEIGSSINSQSFYIVNLLWIRIIVNTLTFSRLAFGKLV